MLAGTSGGSVQVLLENDEEPIFHEGPVLFEDDWELYFTTNRLGNTSDPGPVWMTTAPAQLGQYIDIYKLDLVTNELTVLETNPEIFMANGMTKSSDGRSILALSQGFADETGGVYLLNRTSLEATPIVTTHYGNPFNSLNDIKTTQDGILFLSDPVYGFEQGFRQGNPALGGNVWRYDTGTKTLQIVTTDLLRPNGVALLDDRNGDGTGGSCTLFLTDTGYESTGAQSPRGFERSDSAVYVLKDDSGTCFDSSGGTMEDGWTHQPISVVSNGIQDGIHVHAATKTLLYCDGDGVWVWSIPLLKPLGVILGACTQLIFSQSTGVQTVFILAETQLKTALLNFDEAELAGAGIDGGDSDQPQYPPSNAGNRIPFSSSSATSIRARLFVKPSLPPPSTWTVVVGGTALSVVAFAVAVL